MLFAIVCSAFAQQAATWSEYVANNYSIDADIVYGVANNYQNKLDVIYRYGATKPVPAVIYIHGGGWIYGQKERDIFYVLPYLQMGWVAVNVEYRLGSVSPAPAAVEDCRCALRWVAANAAKYHIDPARLVISGDSAGGHLALMTGILNEAAGLDNNCPGDGPEPHPAAIVNWYGITDVAGLLRGPDRRTYAVQWIGNAAGGEAIARRVSPLTWVRKDLPPIITIHGDADNVVPYSDAVRLHESLDRAGVPNRLFTVHGGHHGGFNDDEYQSAFQAIRQFLAERGLGAVQ